MNSSSNVFPIRNLHFLFHNKNQIFKIILLCFIIRFQIEYILIGNES